VVVVVVVDVVVVVVVVDLVAVVVLRSISRLSKNNIKWGTPLCVPIYFPKITKK
jgi:hypothetical protein